MPPSPTPPPPAVLAVVAFSYLKVLSDFSFSLAQIQLWQNLRLHQLHHRWRCFSPASPPLVKT
ncbi:hypothetical protein SO802_019572 [Lithocarpus litseifolius]|uniref:Uncharacterized protein n=1 Tax=Lithocarpus litseifolius TaxID=425828 RepID=A0AAW2CP53_9ROSI